MTERIRMTRRQLLAGTSRLAFLVWAAPLIAAERTGAQERSREPWFDDGTDWID